MSYRNYYDTSYGRITNRGAAERPTAVTAKYLTTTPTYKSSSIPVLSPERSVKDDSSISSIVNKYSGYNKTGTPLKYEKKDYSDKGGSKYDKKDFNKLSVPSLIRSRDVSPASTSSKYSLSRPSSRMSPDTRGGKTFKDKSRDPSPADREKDIPSKTDKSPGYNGLSSYKLYSRSSNYTRPTPKTEPKPELTVNRYAIANRLSSNYLRPPSAKRTSVSPVNHSGSNRDSPQHSEKSVSPVGATDEKKIQQTETTEIVQNNCHENNDENEIETITVVTRHTSPTPPGSSAYLRTRRADMARTIEKTMTRNKKRPDMADKEMQSDRLDDPTRNRLCSTTRASTTNWSYYTPNVNSYTGYAGRYSTHYTTLREPSSYSDRSSRSRSKEPNPLDTTNLTNCVSEIVKDTERSPSSNNAEEAKQEVVAVYEENKNDDTSEIIINVNLKLKKAKNPLSTTTTELVSPEITITNSHLPPQAPKAEGTSKTKKLKVRKSSTDSSSESSSKKKIVKRRSKSASSSESEQGNDASSQSKEGSPTKNIQRNSSTSKLQNGNSKQKHSINRESNSPESINTLSTQSSISEDDTISKSRTNDISRTSADETSIPTDHSGKQPSPDNSQKNEGGPDEAKSFLIRALAPVTNLFKIRHQDTSDSRSWPENSTTESTGKDVSNLVTESDKSSKNKNTNSIVASNDDNVVKLKAIRRIESGERAWWLESESDKQNLSQSSSAKSASKQASNDENVVKLKAIRRIESGERAWWLDSESDKQNSTQNSSAKSASKHNIPKKIRHVESGERAWWMESNSENKDETQANKTESLDSKVPLNKYRPIEDERPWWLDSNANVPEGVERLTPPRKSSSESDKSEKYNFFKVRHTQSGEKDWWLTSNENSSMSNKPDGQNSLSKSGSDQRSFPLRRIRHVESGERPWWLSDDQNIPEGVEKLPTPPPQQRESDSSDSEEVQQYVAPSQIPRFPLHLPDDEPLGARRSPEGLETPKDNEDYRGRTSPYENKSQYRRRSSSNMSYQKGVEKYISRYTDIDDILGTSGQIYSPFIDTILARRTGQVSFDDDECEEIDPTQVRIHDSTAQMPVIKKFRGSGEMNDYRIDDRLDDTTLQVFKDGDYGPYLDLDSTLGEQEEELEELQDSRKNALILRTQLSVRVHVIIERLLHSQGRELRRALFTLKQVLQSDKDLVHEFVANKGLDCLMQVSAMADHNYLDYILRALGQIMLYVDGMHGVMSHNRCVQWLYSLIESKFRHVVKTALKLLLVFVEYTEKNSLLLIDAINAADGAKGRQPWHNIMKILQDIDASDTELLIYATTLINRCLNNVPDRDTYYDQVDALQDQGMDEIIHLYMSKQGTDLDLLRQLQIFEAVLLFEDGDETGTAIKQLDESVINSLRRRSLSLSTTERRKSKKQQIKEKAKPSIINSTHTDPETKPTTPHRTQFLPSIDKENKDLTSALRRRRDRYARQAHHIIQQQELLNNSHNIYSGLFGNSNGNYTSSNGNYTTSNGNYTSSNGSYVSTNGTFSNGADNYISTVNGTNWHQDGDSSYARSTKNLNLIDVLKNGNQRYTAGLKQRIQNGTLGHSVNATDAITVMRQKHLESPDRQTKDDRGIILNREHSIKDLAQRLTSPVSPTTEDKPLRVSDMAGIVSKAKEELAKSQSKEVIKSPTIEIAPKIHEIKVSENDLHWEELKKGCLHREFHLCDLDFSDLRLDSDDDVGCPAVNNASGPPPPPPSMFPSLGAPPPIPGSLPYARNNVPAPPPKPPLSSELSNDSDSQTIKKNKKTVKLFWREIQDNPAPAPIRSKIGGFIWDDLPEVSFDTKNLEHLFEAKTNDLIIKKLMEPKRNLILDAKRSNAINIAMKKLPTPQTIKAAIMKMDATVVGREGIEKLLTMLPTEEEKIKIQEAQYANPDLPLGSAEQFLLTLASINELSSRLKLWVFKLDFDNLEKEIAEPLMDLKQGIELLKANKTFKVILSTLRSVGSFLNGSQVKGFRLEYLSKVMEVKDTVHKHPLLYHICEMIIEKFPDSTDFFSEVGPVIRASKVDFDVLSANLQKLETDCKASWDHMKRVAKHDSSQMCKTKINEFLTDAAERIILLTVIKKRVMSRYNKFLLYLGVPPGDLSKTKPSGFLKVIAEFALEYRTTRERVLQQLEKRANHRERNKTRGKMIIDVGNYSTQGADQTADRALKDLLKSDTDSLTDGRRKSHAPSKLLVNGDVSADDEIIESLVRSATSKRRPVNRERRRNRISDKKSLNRTLDGTQS